MCCLERALIGKHKMNMLSIFDLAIVKNNNYEGTHKQQGVSVERLVGGITG